MWVLFDRRHSQDYRGIFLGAFCFRVISCVFCTDLLWQPTTQTKEEVRLLCLYRVETCQTTLRTEFSTQSVNQVLQLKSPVATTRSSVHRKLEGCGAHTQSAGSLRVHGCTLSPKLPVHLDAFIPANHEDLLFDSAIRLHAYTCTCLSTYPFILILSFRPTGTVFRSTSLRLYKSARPSIQIYLFSLIFPSGKTRTVTCQLIYWPTYPETYPKLNQPVSLDGFYFG